MRLVILAFTFVFLMTSARALIDQLIASNTVMMFTKSYCPYCQRAKQLFVNLNVSFGEMELDKVDDGATIQEQLTTMTGQRTVPSIFIRGQHVGGCDDVHKLHSQNLLLPKIQNSN